MAEAAAGPKDIPDSVVEPRRRWKRPPTSRHGRSGKSADPDDSIEDEQDTLATGDVSA